MQTQVSESKAGPLSITLPPQMSEHHLRWGFPYDKLGQTRGTQQLLWKWKLNWRLMYSYFLGSREDYVSTIFPQRTHNFFIISIGSIYQKLHQGFSSLYKKPKMLPLLSSCSQPHWEEGQQDPRNYKREVQEAVNWLPNCVVQITGHTHSDVTEEAGKITCKTWPQRPLQCLPHSLCSWHTSLLATPHTPHALAHPPLCCALPHTYMAPLPSSFRVLLKCHLITAASSNSLFAPFHAYFISRELIVISSTMFVLFILWVLLLGWKPQEEFLYFVICVKACLWWRICVILIWIEECLAPSRCLKNINWMMTL